MRQQVTVGRHEKGPGNWKSTVVDVQSLLLQYRTVCVSRYTVAVPTNSIQAVPRDDEELCPLVEGGPGSFMFFEKTNLKLSSRIQYG